jgi:hypothetical protein
MTVAFRIAGLVAVLLIVPAGIVGCWVLVGLGAVFVFAPRLFGLGKLRARPSGEEPEGPR